MTEDYEASLEDHLYEAIGDPKATRDDVAALYALGLRRSVIEESNWAKINQAIIDRWSMSALRYVKEKAWKLVERRRIGAT